MNWAWLQELKPVPKLVLMALADAANNQGICWPRVSTVAVKCSVSSRTVRRAMQTLATRGLLVSEQRYRKDGSCSSNRYLLQITGGDNLSPAPVPDDSSPGQERQRSPDTVVTPGTTIRTQIESPQPQIANTRAAAMSPAASHCEGLRDLVYPKGLSADECEQARLILTKLPIDMTQQLLDELSANMLADTIRLTPLAYLRGLVKRARTGDFIQEAGLQVAEKRRRRAHAETARQTAESNGRDALLAQHSKIECSLAKKVDELRACAARRDEERRGEDNQQ